MAKKAIAVARRAGHPDAMQIRASIWALPVAGAVLVLLAHLLG